MLNPSAPLYFVGVGGMSGRPEERRRHAMVCSRLAESLPDGRARQMFTALAEAWLELAIDLENSQAFLHADLSQPYRFTSCTGDYVPRRRR
jgi:hypothetical protein